MDFRTLLLGLALLASIADTFAETQRVGDWELARRAVFAVAAAPDGPALHFVHSAGGQLRHAHPPDAGAT